MMGRMLRAYSKRVGDADPEDLAEMLAVHAQFSAAIQDAVTAQRARHGTSWADIGRGAGITRQAAQQRWGQQ
jgi:16S rRNA G527 N7-methylase RsmG